MSNEEVNDNGFPAGFRPKVLSEAETEKRNKEKPPVQPVHAGFERDHRRRSAFRGNAGGVCTPDHHTDIPYVQRRPQAYP